MSSRDNKVLIENKAVLYYWIYLEYAKQVLRTKASQNLGVKIGALIFCLFILALCISCIVVFLNPESLQFVLSHLSSRGFLYTTLLVIVVPIAFVYMVFCLFQVLFPYIYLGSKRRTNLSQLFFTDASGSRLKEISITTIFLEDKVVVHRSGNVEESNWKDIVEITESRHFYFLILDGEVIDKHKAYIRSGIILAKDGFTIGSWEDLKGYLAKYGNAELQGSLHAKEEENIL